MVESVDVHVVLPSQWSSRELTGHVPSLSGLWVSALPLQSLQLVNRFEGHASSIVAHDWRVVDDLVFQLVSLDQSQHLRFWRIEPSALRACGHASRGEGGLGGEEEGGVGLGVLGGATAEISTSASLGGVTGRVPGGGSSGVLAGASSASKISLSALKADLHPFAASSSSSAASFRPATSSSSHTASVWQEMIEVRTSPSPPRWLRPRLPHTAKEKASEAGSFLCLPSSPSAAHPRWKT